MWSSERFSALQPRQRRQALLALVSSLCLSGGALADSEPTTAPAASHTATSSAVPAAGPHPQLPASRLQGEATLRFFGLQIYRARLWVGPDFRAEMPGERPAVLELEYLRDFKGAAIAERSLKEMRRAGPLPEAQAQRWLTQMQRVFPDIRAGDRLTGHFHPVQGATFWHNGRAVGQVADADFGRTFLGIWIAPTTSEPAMRRALLGLGDASNGPGGR
jgi:hypothetical protein